MANFTGQCNLISNQHSNYSDLFCKISYFFIGAWLEKNEVIKIPNIGDLNNKQLYIKAIEQNPKYSLAYNNLGN